MPVNLNTIPGPYRRPAPPKPLRWLCALVCFVGFGILLWRVMGNKAKEPSFWWLAIGASAICWTILLSCRLAVYLLWQIRANAWDKRREQVILREVRRGRRSLHILAAECEIAHSTTPRSTDADVIETLLGNEELLIAQASWQGERGIRHSRLSIAEGLAPAMQISAAFANLLERLAEPLSHLPEDNPVAIFLASSSTVSDARVRELWQQSWLDSARPQPFFFITGHGLAVIDHWLDHRIKDKAVLLVIALQIAPQQPEMTGEAVVGMLLGNRLTQKTLTPMALLHRPEFSPPQPETLQQKIVRAMDWVPLHPAVVQHLWLAGLSGSSEGYRCAVVALGQPPLAAIDPGVGIHNVNEFLGDPGRAAPWLAITAAAQAISRCPAPHMIINGEQGGDAVWTTVVSPDAAHKENNA